MFSKILIANRGEISCRITRTAHRLGVKTVAVYSDADAGAMHVQAADEGVHLGPAPSRESYLRADKIIAAALATGARAIHPGYGFLSENAGFSRACREAGLVFIGPSAEAITAMGSKSGAKTLMEKAGVPLIPGYHGDNQDEAFLLAEARKMGFPVLLKASAGGGGKGMRAVHEEKEFSEALHAAQREASNAFGDDRMLIEKLLVEPRHVEVQILADRHGNAVYVFDRDCSIQRRHQKVVEEAPAPGLSPELRRAMGEAAVRAAKAIDYEGAGTLEFLVDRDGHFYFMEMNTRLQVEHPVTELISGLDLVELQLRIANGEPLPFTQADLQPRGHAMEVRLYAEDPHKEFLPSTGTLQVFELPAPEGVRVDTGYRSGDAVSVYYDPMMAKVIAWGETRDIAAERLCNALRQARVAGVKHNARFLTQVLSHPAFREGEISTHFIAQHEGDLLPRQLERQASLLLLAGQVFLQDGASGPDATSPWRQLQGFRVGAPDVALVRVKLDDEVHEVRLTPGPQGYQYALASGTGRCTLRAVIKGDYLLERDGHSQVFSVERQGDHLHVFIEGEHIELVRTPRAPSNAQAGDERHYRAPMNGRIVSVNVQAGDSVQKGDTLLVMEAMKMEHRIRAHGEGVIAGIPVAAGDLVSEGQNLVDL
ncbi:MAG: acetyl/propionyl/methylcrotonyl-CoA carboxylase subunit alpha [Moraxellaceae bacterium]|jgi:3-methylcrotonyl-CoA carboxylase alpha subunit|nr:acetyl/propionyl/methylcrotonyl-CoA carboxylase subunit alpha [Moraxellaceae bacterium]